MKDLKISKELLGEVLKLEVVKHSLFNKSNKSFNITYMQSEDSLKSSWMPINIYEFAFKCKEWAYKQCYEIISYTEGCKIYQTQIGEIIKEFYADSEQHAIVKACEWILKEKNNDTK